MRAVIRYPGSKWGIADWIIGYFPEGYEKLVYLEPFVGSGAVFFNKRPSVVETINDLDSDVVNLFQVLRQQPEELKRVLSLTSYSREEYDKSFLLYEEPVEKARRFMVRTIQAIGVNANWKNGWRNHKKINCLGTANKWIGCVDSIECAANRLRGSTSNLVQIEHMDALRLIERYDSQDVLMYLDPPYVRSSRKSGKLYRHEMDDADQRRLLEIVTRSRAKIILSGYDSPLYCEALHDWQRFTTFSQTTSAAMAEEVIWLNYEPPFRQISITD